MRKFDPERFVKRLLCAALVMLLCFGSALGESFDGRFVTKHYSLRLPKGWLADTDNLKTDGDYRELGYLYPEDDSATLCVFAWLDYYEDWKTVSLWKGDEDEMAEYIAATLKDYAEYAPEIADTISAGRIPFVILRLWDGGSAFYRAETMTNGYVVGFECYAMDERFENYRSVTDEEYAVFGKMLRSFMPMY